METAHCANCKLAVIVLPNEKPIKACDCKAPIVMDMGSTLAGKSGLNHGVPKPQTVC